MVYNRQTLTEMLTQKPINECMAEPSPDEVAVVTSKIFTSCPRFNIQLIKAVKNSFLEAMYLLKKEEVKRLYKRQPREELMIHVTSGANAAMIIRDNFDWRRVTRSKFGLGTSFSDDAEYANKYANHSIGANRAFIITKVLVTKFIRGRDRQIIPPPDFDTTTGNNKKVYVKYHDNEMLPLYVVYYTWGQVQQIRSPLSATSGTAAGRLNRQRNIPPARRNPYRGRYPGDRPFLIDSSIPQPTISSGRNTSPNSSRSNGERNSDVCCFKDIENFGQVVLLIVVVGALLLWIKHTSG